MNAARPPGAPSFRTALVESGKQAGALDPRRIRSALAGSLAAHLLLALGVVATALLTIGPIPPPRITMRFFAAPPPVPKLVPLRERPEPPRVAPRPPAPAHRDPAPVPALRIPPPPPPAAPPRPRATPPPLRVEAAGASIHLPEAAPDLRVYDDAPPVPRAASPALGRVSAQAARPAGSGAEPDLVFLKPGRERPRGTGGGAAGAGDGLPNLPALEGGGTATSRGRGTSGHPDGIGAAPLGTEESFTGTGTTAAALGRRYGVALIEAARLGQRTSEGAAYAILVPRLSEAYRQVRLRGTWRPAQADPGGLASAEVNPGAIAIRYDDGALHVIVPTKDGLVALYVSAGDGKAGARSKVGEAERALRALQRLAQVRGS